MSLPLPQLQQGAEQLGTPIILWSWQETASGSGLYELVPGGGFSASLFANAQVSAAGDTEIVSDGAPRRVLGYTLEASGDAAMAAAGVLIITLGDFAHTIWLPADADTELSGVLWSTGFTSLGSLGQLYDDATPINLNLSAALTRGVINLNLQYQA